MPEKRKRIVVAMSGGVDSSVVAGLMRDEGHEVIGITLRLYDHGNNGGGQTPAKAGSCCAGSDIRDARLAAEKLGIAHYVLDYESYFKTSVIDDFADSYIKGETPVPCVRCNQYVKFTDLLAMAHKLEADALATGHYVRKKTGPSGPMLLRGKDASRDQSYFLFATLPDQLSFLEFPLGDRLKTETRELARQYNLALAEKPDSQDICFVPDGNYRDLLLKLRPEAFQPGNIVDEKGAILGQHDGIANFTVGQRRGISIGGLQDPLYVLSLDPQKRQVIVGPASRLGVTRIELKQINWLADRISEGEKGLRVSVKCRSTMKPAAGRFFVEKPGRESEEGTGYVLLDEPHRGVSPGQACVLYKDEQLLGGGWITRNKQNQTQNKAQTKTLRAEAGVC